MIITKLKGGMGNQMFQYALGRALSLKYGVPLKLDIEEYSIKNKVERHYDLDLFNISAEVAQINEIPKSHRNIIKNRFLIKINSIMNRFFKEKGSEVSFTFDSSILNIGPDAYLDGYWQSPKYFENIESIIRKDFTLKNKLPLNIENLKEVIKKENSLCIHIRRGDYVGNAFHEIVGKEYYRESIEKMKSLTTVDKIYVFSDDIKWCEDNMKFDLPVMFVGEEYAGQKAEGHMTLMSACHNFIIPNSSFAWWSAYLCEFKDKKVIVPKQWFTDASINSDDLIPKDWIRV